MATHHISSKEHDLWVKTRMPDSAHAYRCNLDNIRMERATVCTGPTEIIAFLY
jgi:hypothetical protein